MERERKRGPPSTNRGEEEEDEAKKAFVELAVDFRLKIQISSWPSVAFYLRFGSPFLVVSHPTEDMI